ncbi:MAG: TrkA family potassium uptake protein [Deltaproteobacteria bacterium]|nr:TrkA family potassium uptake protein [Deltaproteobacteria bacterium]
MGAFAVIGAGNFGATVAKTLFQGGREIVAVDRDKARIQAIQSFISHGIIADATDKTVIGKLGLEAMEAVIVSVGKDVSASILITLFLKEIKVPKIIVKVTNEDHGRALQLVGATDTIFPERDMALKVASTLISPNILDSFALSEDYAIMEIAAAADFIGKNLVELDLRKRRDITVIAIKDVLSDLLLVNPPASFVIKDSNILVVIGKRSELEAFSK